MTGFRQATRREAKPLIGLYSESGCGKTWSALLLARGFVGPGGVIGMIETEGGRGEAYVGREPVGNYLVRPIRQVFSPQAYGEAITEAEQAKLDALIVDSASHEWEGNGGVLAMAAANQSAGKKGVLVWQQPKIEHQRHFMLRLMQTTIPLVIICMRAKYPMEQVKGEQWARSKVLEPKQADDILFEMFVHGWVDAEHKFNVTKYTLPELASIIVDKQQITIQSGRALAQWAAGTPATTQPSSPGPHRETEAAPSVPPTRDDGAAGLSETDEHAETIAVLRSGLAKAATRGEEIFITAWQSVPEDCRDALLPDAARDAARAGKATMDAFWPTISKTQLDALRPMFGELRAIVEGGGNG